MPETAIHSVIKFIENRKKYDDELKKARWLDTGGGIKSRDWNVTKTKLKKRLDYLKKIEN